MSHFFLMCFLSSKSSLVWHSVCCKCYKNAIKFVGIWHPWKNKKGAYIDYSSYRTREVIEQSRLGDCMMLCLRKQSRSCKSIVMSVKGNQCQIGFKRSNDTGAILLNSTEYQYFDRPYMYLGRVLTRFLLNIATCFTCL